MTGTLSLTAATPLQITTTSPAPGKILTSDASGNASWATVGSGATVPMVVSGSQPSASILTVQNTASVPSVAALVVTSQSAGDRSFGVQVVGDTNRRLMVDSNGVQSWGPGNAPGDTNLYRSAASTLKTDNNLAVGGTLTLAADPASALQAATKQYADRPLPQAWTAFGHSYLQNAVGTQWTTGRMDAMFRMTLGIHWGQWRNHCVQGAALNQDTRRPGGWGRVMQDLVRQTPSGQNIHGAPYFPDGGGYLLVYGINDIGATPTATQAQIRAAYQSTLRAVIARCRTSVIWEDNYVPVSGTVGQPVYGAGFTTTTGTTDSGSGTTLHDATALTNATVTLTLPADYAGETVLIQFIANPGAVGGTITFSGSAGVTGTLSTSNILPGVSVKLPVVRRITNLTSANAGQTIIMTVTQIDAGGTVRFDYWGLESKTPPPVIVANCARVLAAGYASFGNPIGDADVTALNSAMTPIIAEFDGMVQLADIDSALNKDTNLFGSDGLHPNEFGAAKAAQACLNAVRKLVPTDVANPGVNANPSAPISSGMRRPRFSSQYYTAEFAAGGTAAVLVSGDMYAIPFVVTEGRELYQRIAINQVAAGASAGAIRWGIYDDVSWTGFPQCLYSETAGPFSLTAAAGIKEQTGLSWTLDPGLWWIAAKCTTAVASQTYDWMNGPDASCIMPLMGAAPNAGATLANNATPIGWKITGQGTGAFPPVFPTAGGTLSTAATVPKVAIFKA